MVKIQPVNLSPGNTKQNKQKSELGQKTYYTQQAGFHRRLSLFSCTVKVYRTWPGVERCTCHSSAICIVHAPARLTQTTSPFFDSIHILFDNKYCCQVQLLNCNYLQILSRPLISHSSHASRFSLRIYTRLVQLVRRSQHSPAFSLSVICLLKAPIC